MNTANSDSVIERGNPYAGNIYPIGTSFAVPSEYEEKFKLVFENAPLGIALVDPFWKIIDANQKLCEILNYSLLEITGKDIREITYSKDLGATFQQMNKVQKGEIDNYEIKKRYIKSTGEIVPVNIHSAAVRNKEGKLLYSIVMVKDLTIEEKKDEQLQRLGHSINSITEMVSITDEENKFVFVNKAFLERYGYTEKEIIGKTPLILNPDPEGHCEIIKGQPRWEGELLNITKSGEKFYIHLETSVVKDGNGELAGNIGIAKDITEQIETEEKLKRSETLAALGKMTSYLSHELKSPLTAIKLNVEILMEQMKGDKNATGSFSIINKEIKRLESMLKDVLQFSKQREILYQQVSPEVILKQVIALLHPVLESKNIRIINRVSSEAIIGDPDQLKTVLHHILENSLDAIGTDGEIEFMSVPDRRKKMHRIFIRDNGCGIKSTKRIFEPFYTTKQNGTGLGLSIVQQIIEKHNGTISLIFSEPGNTIFQVSLPMP